MSKLSSATVTEGMTKAWYWKSNCSEIPTSAPNKPLPDKVQRLGGLVGDGPPPLEGADAGGADSGGDDGVPFGVPFSLGGSVGGSRSPSVGVDGVAGGGDEVGVPAGVGRDMSSSSSPLLPPPPPPPLSGDDGDGGVLDGGVADGSPPPPPFVGVDG